MKFFFDLGDVFFDWYPNYFFKNVFDDYEERKYFLIIHLTDPEIIIQEINRFI